MAQKFKIKAILKAAQDMKTVWETNPDFNMGHMQLADFRKIYAAAEAIIDEYSRRRIELIGIKNQRDDQARELNNLVTRFRSGMRAYYGPDSPQYGQAGGTRSSARKPSKRKSK